MSYEIVTGQIIKHLLKMSLKLGMVVRIYNHSTGEVETGGLKVSPNLGEILPHKTK
jgi:hypothetical protein